MIGLLGKKIGMTQIFSEQGRQMPVTVLEVGPCHVTAIRTKDRDGYTAVQLGFGVVKEKNVSKPRKGQFQKAKTPSLRYVREVRTPEIEGLQVGQKIRVDNFEAGDFVDVEGISIGKGFQGVVKRHGFKGSASKGHGSMHGREPGSIGQSSYPSRVLKGMRAGGHMGSDRVTLQNVKILKVDTQNNLLVVHGSVPGTEETCLMIRTALKKGKARKWKQEKQEKPQAEKPPKASAEKPPAKEDVGKSPEAKS